MRCVYDIRVVSASVRQGTVEGLDDVVDAGPEANLSIGYRIQTTSPTP